MSCAIAQTETTTFKLIEHDGQWIESEFKVLHNRTVNPHSFLKMDKGVVSCTGSHSENGTRFKLYKGARPGQPMKVLFECIDGPSKGLMISHNNGMLSCKRNSAVPIVNFSQADSDIIFHLEQVSSQSSMMKFKTPHGYYMGFDSNGKALPLKDVNVDGINSWEGKFMLVHAGKNIVN